MDLPPPLTLDIAATEAPTFDIALRFHTEAEYEDTPWHVTEDKLYNLLATFISSDISAISTAKKINLLFRSCCVDADEDDRAYPEPFLWEVWCTFAEIANQLPGDHPSQERLVEAVKALRDLPDPIDVYMEGWGTFKLWSELPLLAPVLGDGYSGDQNRGAFIARLTREDILHMAWFGLCSLRDALEKEPDPRARAYHTQGPQLDSLVPAAAFWIMIAGKAIHQECLDQGPKESDSVKGGRNWKGVPGCSKERWDFWKKRFGEIKVHDQPSDETKKLTAEAEKAMNEIEAD